ncbi:SDR family NAD(P)-dependent oxidoreductase [Agrobacterium vitis]|uniref:SDR family NAD(P)-dependent oxidoreductase n=1 Tax=Agrobacterium vitis TaxID=373 RepID=UPI00144C352D|nr:SDR family NAD(P)-dependent oxidoreductase [Agrobacterium vitis]MCF1468172.1 SDR family NAD(P)-dependent oxidoreductase [Agrobacterium vitis]MVA36598.1 SDR family NAD(P)-dependent oxidoreductase [Agrobacterium vitis]
MNSRNPPRHVIITGGSSGIGLALARAYLLAGSKVSLVARSLARLETARDSLPQPCFSHIGLHAADVTDYPALSAALLAAEDSFGPCDLLITCAGIVHPASMAAMDIADARQQFDINVMGTIHAVKALWAGMSARGGTMLLVSSGAAFIGLHGYGPYCASKAALVGLADSLRMEAVGTKLTVAICFPPDTDTPQLAAELPMRSPQAQRVMGTVKPWSPDAVAARIVGQLQKGRREIVFGMTLLLLARFGSLVRPVLYWWYSRR